MNQYIEKMLTRHAIRRFQQRQIDDELLEQILLSGLYAPTAGNNQKSRIVVCQNREINKKLGKLSRALMYGDSNQKLIDYVVSHDQPSILDDLSITDGFYGAPTVLTIFSPQTPYTHDDAAMIAAHIWLAAHFLDLGACYIGRAEQVFATPYGKELRQIWGIEENLIPVCHILLGYIDGDAPKSKARKGNRIVRIR